MSFASVSLSRPGFWGRCRTIVASVLVPCLLMGGALALSGCGAGHDDKKNEDAVTTSAGRQYPLSNLSRRSITLTSGPRNRSVECWILDDQGKRDEGMALLIDREIDDRAGMLLVYPDAARRVLWGINLYIPLDVAFVDADGVIRSIQQLDPVNPRDPKPITSPAGIQYVVELKRGMFSQLGVRTGDSVRGLGGLASGAK